MLPPIEKMLSGKQDKVVQEIKEEQILFRNSCDKFLKTKSTQTFVINLLIEHLKKDTIRAIFQKSNEILPLRRNPSYSI